MAPRLLPPLTQRAPVSSDKGTGMKLFSLLALQPRQSWPRTASAEGSASKRGGPSYGSALPVAH